MADSKEKERTTAPAVYVAAATSVPDLASFLDTFKPVEQKRDTVLKGSQKHPHMRITQPAYGRTNVGGRKLFTEAADKQALPSRRFGALRVWFSEPLQAMLCRPEASFVEGQPDLVQVTWSPDEREMRCDFAYVLVPLQWSTPKGWVRVVPVRLVENLPRIGTAILLDLKESQLEQSENEQQSP